MAENVLGIVDVVDRTIVVASIVVELGEGLRVYAITIGEVWEGRAVRPTSGSQVPLQGQG